MTAEGSTMAANDVDSIGKLAVVGMACRFPESRNPDEFWKKLHDGKELIRSFSDEELAHKGIDASVLANKNYVKARGEYQGVYLFDAPLFGYTPREAELIDPQQRVFLECAWEALENAGYNPFGSSQRIGLFAGAGSSQHLLQIAADPAILASAGMLTLVTSSDKDYLATRLGYKLNLTGPCVTVQTACSTSLVAIILACQSLLTYQSDLALAGGVKLDLDEGGYFFQQGGILSPDGHCRSFDRQAQGTVPCSGTGIVVLKRLEDALADRDIVRAVVIGYGLNNDGAIKIGFTAPGVDGQTAVVLEATTMANVNPESISYVECHGTGTPLGDPIEIAALTKAFRSYTQKKQFCAIGSVKSNMGHADAAAGVAGFIKTALALQHMQVPPTLHVSEPNPEINFEDSPFYLNTRLADWKRGNTRRRAAVNSLGMGGTNAHVILEEAPASTPYNDSSPCELLAWSAKSAPALDRLTANLARAFQELEEERFPDAAYTLQIGRIPLDHRRIAVCRNKQDALRALEGPDHSRIFTSVTGKRAFSLAFLFPGQGSQYVNMGRELYCTEGIFRKEVDRCADFIKSRLGADLRDILFPSTHQYEAAVQALGQTIYAQPALFTIEYALAQLWIKWAAPPEVMIGHSLGEYVAACLAGVLPLEAALELVVTRGKLMQQLPAGAMLAVNLPRKTVEELISRRDSLSIAAVNTSDGCVVSGSSSQVDELEQQLVGEGIRCQRLNTSHAFHSSMMDPILRDFSEAVAKMPLQSPRIPYISNVTGTWITAAQATSPEYWAHHLRHTVRFKDGADLLVRDRARVLIEVGPGRTLTSFIPESPEYVKGRSVLVSLPRAEQQSARALLLENFGKLWLQGFPVNWAAFSAARKCGRIPLPTYPFEHKLYRLAHSAGSGTRHESSISIATEAGSAGASEEYRGHAVDGDSPAQVSRQITETMLERNKDASNWFYVPSWKRCAPLQDDQLVNPGSPWLLFADECGIGREIASRLVFAGHEVILVSAGRQFRVEDGGNFTIRPGHRADYFHLASELRASERTPAYLLHMWNVTPSEHSHQELDCFSGTLDLGFYSLLFFAQAFGELHTADSIKIYTVTSNLYDVSGERPGCPSKAGILGPMRAIPREYPSIQTRIIDITVPQAMSRDEIVRCILSEISTRTSDETVAYRGGHRWTPIFEPIRIQAPEKPHPKLREKGVFLITGGLGGMGLVLARYLALTVHARLVLVGRSEFPQKHEWDKWSGSGKDPIGRKIMDLKQMEAAGAEILVLSADVTDHAQMKSAIERVNRHFGKIHGVIHAAGSPPNGIIGLKTREAAQEVLAPKIHGTLILENLLRGADLDFFILCSSLTVFSEEAGAVDYIAANAFLDAFAHANQDAGRRSLVSINWNLWTEVGMAVSSEQADRKRRSSKQTVPPLKNSEKVLLGGISMQHSVKGDADIFTGSLNPALHWIVGDHRVGGLPTVVGTAFLELARAAFECKSHANVVELRDIVFQAPLTLGQGEERTLELTLEPSGEFFSFQIKSMSMRSRWQLHASGKIRSVMKVDPPQGSDLSLLLERIEAGQVVVNSYTAEQAAKHRVVQAGLRWQSLISQVQARNEAVAVLKLPVQFEGELQDFGLHPALLDIATSFDLERVAKAGFYLPCSYEQIRIYKRLTGELYSHVWYTGTDTAQQEFITANIALFDPSGELLLEIHGYNLKLVHGAIGSGQAKRMLSAGEHVANEAGAVSFREIFGITSEEGIDIFARILTLTSVPQVAIATVNLNRCLDRAKSAPPEHTESYKITASPTESGHGRPELPTPYVAPRTELQRTVAGIWESLWGISGIGIYDNFDDLGGHSLLALQLVSRIREIFKIDFPIGRLYDNPTVMGVSEVIESVMAQEQIHG